MYYLKFKVDKLPMKNDWASAISLGPIILTKTDDEALLCHEKFHVRMFWYFVIVFGLVATVTGLYWLWVAGPVLRSILYAFVPKYRLWEEIKAHAEQYTCSPKKSKEFLHNLSEFIYLNYDAGESYETILKRLEKEID